jgi:ribosomal protein S18 acetylase RimI-like enzyme
MRMSSIIENGWITKNKRTQLSEDVRYEMRFVDKSSLMDMMELQEIIFQNLSDKEIFRTHSLSYFEEHFEVENSVIGVFTEDGLVAYNVLFFPGLDSDNFGADINLPEEELDKVVHLETVAVHPAYRGNSLQRKMEAVHLNLIKDMGFEHVCCTVSPKNHPSLQNVFSNGLAIKALKIKFGGRLRYIMHRNLSYPNAIKDEEILIDSLNIDGQIELLKKGLHGFRISKFSSGFLISYGRDHLVVI